MGTSAAPNSAGSEPKASPDLVGAGIGFAAGFTAPLLTGVALSAVGFTSKGVAAESLAASWKHSGGSLFNALQSTAEGLNSKVALGLGAVLGTAAAVAVLVFKGKKPALKYEDTTPVSSDNFTLAKEEELSREVVETVTAKKTILSETEAITKQEASTEADNKHNESIKEEVASDVEEQIVHVTLIQNQHKVETKEKATERTEKPVILNNEVKDVVVDAVVKLASAFQPEKSEIDEQKSEKLEIGIVIPAEKAEAVPTDVVHHSTKPGEEAEMLKEAVEQLVETEVVSEELPSIEECLDREDGRHVSEEIEILTTSEIASPVLNSSVATSLFQELVADDGHPTPLISESVTTSMFQELAVEDEEKNSETPSGVLKEATPLISESVATSVFQELTVEDFAKKMESTSDVADDEDQEQAAPAPTTNDSMTTSLFQVLTVENVEPNNISTDDDAKKIDQKDVSAEGATSQNEETLPHEVSKEAFSAIQKVADRLINEIESVLSGGASVSSTSEEHETIAKTRESNFLVEALQNEEKSVTLEKQPETEERQERLESFYEVSNQDEEEESDESAYEEADSEESDEGSDEPVEVEDKDTESEKQLKTTPDSMTVSSATKALEQKESNVTAQEKPNDQVTPGEKLGEFSWDTNKHFQATKL